MQACSRRWLFASNIFFFPLNSSNETLTQPWSNLRTIHSQLRYQCASARKIAQSLNKEADYCKDVTCPGCATLYPLSWISIYFLTRFSPPWFSILNTDCKPEDCPAMLLRLQLKDCSKLETFVTCLQLFKRSPIVGGIHSRVHILNNWIRLYIGSSLSFQFRDMQTILF